MNPEAIALAVRAAIRADGAMATARDVGVPRVTLALLATEGASIAPKTLALASRWLQAKQNA